MRTVGMVREKYFNATGSKVLPNGCIEFTYFIPGGAWAEVDPQEIVEAIKNNPNETGRSFNRQTYIEEVNAWLSKIGSPELRIPLIYNVATETGHKILHRCKCGHEHSETKWVSDSPETEKWGLGERPIAPNFIREHIKTDKTEIVETDSCAVCEEERRVNIVVEAIPSLADEVYTRQLNATQFFHDHPDYNPSDYVCVHKSTGYNPTAKNRQGCQIGYTNKGRYTKYVAYIVRRDFQ